MNTDNIEEIYWKDREGNTKLFTELSEEELNNVNAILQKRQVQAYSSLEMSCKMQVAIQKIAKSKKINLVDITDTNRSDWFKSRFILFKDIIDRINRQIKLKIAKDGKQSKNVLQEG